MRFPATADKANISEIFSSLQGEGTCVGQRHIFIRFEECHIHCVYCDELDKPGTPKTIENVINEVKSLIEEYGQPTYISLTGGEPLLYIKFLEPLIARLKEQGQKIYLETDGILWKTLEQSIELFDCIAMDMKPASVTGERNFFEEHEKFLKLAAIKDVFVKIVLSKQIDEGEFTKLIRIIEKVDSSIPLILQPISNTIEGHDDNELMKLLYELQKESSVYLNDVRIVPRLHKILGIR